MSSLLQKELELSPEEKRALLAEVLRKKAAQPKTVPLSFAEQRLWLLAQLEPKSAAYNIPRALRLRGQLNVNALQKTFNEIITRHEVLRASFELVNGAPVRRVVPHLEIEVPLVDVSDLPEIEREREIISRVAAEARKPFDLTCAPLMRVALIRVSDVDHVLLLTTHHIVSDGWSMGILFKEIAAAYEGAIAERTVDLPHLPIQYSDFATWQRQYLQGEVLDDHLSYWHRQLLNAPSVLNLPVARPRPAMQTFNGSHLSQPLSKELMHALVELSRHENVTLFMTLLAAFQTLLYRYTGQEDIVLGSPIAGRNRAEVENLIGFFINSLPLRTSLAGNPTFRELQCRVKEVALNAFAHQDLPFEKIVEELQPERSLSYSPIFQVMFALQNQPRAGFSLPDLKVELLKREAEYSKFDLTLYMTETGEGLDCWLEYNTDLFARETMERLLHHFEILLESIVADPDKPISELQLLDEAERRELLVDWNNTASDYSTTECLQQLFEAQVERTPESIALVCGEQQLSYRELNSRANQLAHYLVKLGVGQEDRVAIYLPRQIDMVVAVLGTLKAGGAYVPLDAAYPAERLGFTLKDSGATMLLTEADLLQQLPETATHVVCLSDVQNEIDTEDNANPPNPIGPRNLAYVIYTSASTGQSKGVAIEHASAVTFVRWAISAFTSQQLASVLLSTSLCFDLSVFELFAPLCSGGKVILVENVLQLLELNGDAVTLVNTVPSAMTELIRMHGIPDSVKTVNLAGEPLTNNLVRNIYAHSKVEQVLNLYGPSEDTTYSTFARLPPDVTVEPSIGRPVANTQTYVLDGNLEPMPKGLPGELFLGGAGLARGYLDRPSLTAERFVPNPFSDIAGSRLYRTGDLVRYLPDGSLQFLGRLDHQVKLRGYRIEPGEIETLLREQPNVRDAVVVVQTSGEENKELIGYVEVASAADQTLIQSLSSSLKSRLPNYMIPAHFVLLEKLPLTPNGKLDRAALPAPDQYRKDVHSRVAPQDDVEERLARVWTQILNVDTVGVSDNFFEIGGHSLLAVRLMAEIQREFSRKLPLVTLFQNATIEGLANILRQDAQSLSWPTLIQIKQGSTPPLFCVSPPNVNALGYRMLARHLSSYQTVYGLQAHYPEDLEGEHSQAAVEDLAAEYLAAIQEVQPQGPYQFVGMCRGAHIAFEMARRLEMLGQQVAFVGVLDTWVFENTYNRFLYVEHYARRLRSLFRLSLKEQWALIKHKRHRAAAARYTRSLPPDGQTKVLANPTQAYFPGPEFKPKTYGGRVSVFRVHRQPLDRIHDRELGWGKLATGGIDLHFITGRHGISVLSEPHVQMLATKLKTCLIGSSQE